MTTRITGRQSIGLAKVLGWFALVTFLAAALPTVARAQCSTPGNPPCSGTFLNGYYDTGEPLSENGTGAGDNFLRLNNPTRANGNLCALIYVFDDDEDLGECCGCPLSPDKLLSLSVQRNLTANWALTPRENQSGVIDIISTSPSPASGNAQPCSSAAGCNDGCNPTGPQLVPTRELKGYILHNQLVPAEEAARAEVLRIGPTEVPLADAGDADPAELTFLPTQCAALIGNGSGTGVCDCGLVETPPPATPTATPRRIFPTPTAMATCIPVGAPCSLGSSNCCGPQPACLANGSPLPMCGVFR